MPRSIPVTRGLTTLVDDENYAWLSQYTWHCTHNGYAASRIHLNGGYPYLYMHRLILGARPGQFVDHINGDKLYNTRANLRFVTRDQLAGEAGDVTVASLARVLAAWISSNKGRWTASSTALLFINQARSKIGVSYGDPDSYLRQRPLLTVDEVITPQVGNCTIFARYVEAGFATQVILNARLTRFYEREDWAQRLKAAQDVEPLLLARGVSVMDHSDPFPTKDEKLVQAARAVMARIAAEAQARSGGEISRWSRPCAPPTAGPVRVRCPGRRLPAC